MDKKPSKNILIYNVAYKTQYGAKPLHIIFNKVDGYIRNYDKTRYLQLLHSSNEKYERMFDGFRYLIMFLSNISDLYSYKYTKIKINSDDDIPLGKTETMHNVIISIKSVLNKNYNHYFYIAFLVKCS